MSLLDEKAGPILFQLPPNFHADADRLASFLKLLSKAPLQFGIPASQLVCAAHSKAAVEQNISLCLSDHPRRARAVETHGRFRLCQGHGPGGVTGALWSRALKDWAKRIRSWKQQGCDAFVISTTTKRALRRPMPSCCDSYAVMDARQNTKSLLDRAEKQPLAARDVFVDEPVPRPVLMRNQVNRHANELWTLLPASLRESARTEQIDAICFSLCFGLGPMGHVVCFATPRRCIAPNRPRATRARPA